MTAAGSARRAAAPGATLVALYLGALACTLLGNLVIRPLAALYVNLRTGGVWVPRLYAPDLLLTPAIHVAIGVAIAARRYA